MMKIGITGRYNFEVGKGDKVRHKVEGVSNLITNNGLNRLGVGFGFDSCIVGTSNIEPQITDEWLFGFVARTTTRSSLSWTIRVEPDGGRTLVSTAKYRFAEGVAAGNLSEVGMAWGSLSGTLFSRALIRDEEGNPTSITVLNDEFLDVTYIHEYRISLEDTIGTTVLDGAEYQYKARFMGVRAGSDGWNLGSATNPTIAFHSWFGGNMAMQGVTTASLPDPVDPAISPQSSPSSSSSGRWLHAYENNSFRRRASCHFGLTQGNLSGGIRSFVFTFQRSSSSSHYLIPRAGIEFEPRIPKTSDKLLTLTVEVRWGRVEEEEEP